MFPGLIWCGESHTACSKG